MQRFFIWGGFALALLLILGAVLRSGTPNITESTVPPIRESDHVYGDRSAKVVLIEYSDFQCPACRMYTPVVAQIEQEFPNDVAVVYRHFPLRTIHKHAELAARASEAAALQGKFFEMHDALFVGQETWSQEMDPLKSFVDMAQQLGLDTEKFSQDIKSSEVKKAVQVSVDEAKSLGITSTPSFFLQGSFVENPGGNQLVELVKAEVEKAKATP